MDNLIIRNDEECRLSRMEKVEFGKWDKGSLLLKGMAVNFNTLIPKDGKPQFILENGCISQDIIDGFMKKPILLVSHDMQKLAIGEVLKMEIRPNGLYAEAVVRPAGEGKNVIEQMEANPIRSFSIGFIMESPDYDDELDVFRVKKISELFDLSIVNLGRDEEAVFEIAQTFNKSVQQKTENRRRKQMPESKIITPEEFSAVQTELAETKVLMINIDKTATEKVAKIEQEIKDAHTRFDLKDSEMKEFVDKFMTENKQHYEKLFAAQQEAKFNVIGEGSINNLPIKAHMAISQSSEVLRGLFTSSRFDQIDEFRKMSDMALFAYQMIYPQREGRAGEGQLNINPELWAKVPFAGELNKLAQHFAMDTATSDEGSQFIPTGYSPQFIEMIRLASKVDGLFNTFNMREASEVASVEGSDILATRHTQTIAAVSAFDSTEQTPGSANVTYTAEKLRTRIQISGEITEDSMIEIFGYVMKKSTIGIARAIDNWYIAGDSAGGTAFDSGDTPGSTEATYCGNGLRYHANANSSTCQMDMSTFDHENLMKLFGLMGKYAVDPTRLAFINSAKGYFFNWMGSWGKDYVMTVDKIGPNAIVATGQLAQAYGVPIVLSEWVLDTYDSTGVYSGAGNSNTIQLLVHRDAHRRGIYRGVTSEIVRDAINDVYDVVSFHRTDIQNDLGSSETHTVAGINVPTV